jgi:uncharacterized membrane protein HdeD (DUF308 family)
MYETLKRDWRLIVLRGVAALIFGILAFAWPGATLSTLVILFALYALFDGVVALTTGIKAPKGMSGRGSLLLKGVIDLAAGVIALLYPGITAVSLLYLIGAWAIFSGGAEIGAAFLLRHELTNELFLMLGGAISVLFGLLMFRNPNAGALAVIWLIGTFAIIYGAMLLMLAFELKRLGRDIRPTAGAVTG